MLTAKPILKAHFSMITGRIQAPQYRHTHKPKFSDRDTIRERYKKPSLRLRAVGSREETSVKLERIYEPPSDGLYWMQVHSEPTPGKTRHASALIEVTAYPHDEEVPTIGWPGIEYFANVTEFLAAYPDRRDGVMGRPMDDQFTVNHFNGKTYPSTKIDGITVVDGMPILFKDQK